MIVLVADSGSTSTNWALVSSEGCLGKWDTNGLNPYYLSHNEIQSVISDELFPSLPLKFREQISQIYFYGSGCSTANNQKKIGQCLQIISAKAAIFVDHDLLAAAKSCCGEGKGIGCILGTGSNSCVYDGKNIKKNAISLGYFLGDEGSGTHIGKLFVTELIKKRVSKKVEELFQAQYNLTSEEILNKIYQSDNPHHFLGQFSKFVSAHVEEHNELKEIVKNSFRAFIKEFIDIYPESASYPINFVGSAAYFFQDILKETLQDEEYTNVQNIVRYPIEGLIAYHQQQMTKKQL